MNNFTVQYNIDKSKIINKFKLHNHNGIEVFMFIDGDADYIVEGTVYHLEPYDIIILRPDEMHRAFRKSEAVFTRMVLNVDSDFFKSYNITQYLKKFTQYEPGKNNKIPAEAVKQSGLYDCYMRIKKYSDNFKNLSLPVIGAVVCEMLCIISTLDICPELVDSTSKVSAIVKYINNNFKNQITLNSISSTLFISKTHMCRIFKKATGYTINSYINHKRLIYVSELCRKGENIGMACIEAGFNSYANFYKTYVKETHTSPGKGLKI